MYFSEHLFCSPLHGGWLRYYTTTDQMRDRDITVVLLILFIFLECLRLPESSIKIWDDAHGVKKVLDPRLCGQSVPGLVPEI